MPPPPLVELRRGSPAVSVETCRGAMVSTLIGPSLNSNTALSDARSIRLGPGDVQIIPPGVGHGFTSIDPRGIEYLIFRVDPDHVLSLQ